MLKKLVPFVLVLVGCVALPCLALEVAEQGAGPLGSIDTERRGDIDPLG